MILQTFRPGMADGYGTIAGFAGPGQKLCKRRSHDGTSTQNYGMQTGGPDTIPF
jgi:hypothetical protein